MPIDYNMESEISIELEGVAIKLKSSKYACKLCGSALKGKCTLQICAECIQKIKNI